MKIIKPMLLGTLLAASFLCQQAFAGIINVTYDGFSKGNLSVQQTLNNRNRNALAGMFQFNVNSVSGVTAFDIQPGGKIDAFCVELSQNLKTTGQVAYELVDGLTYFNSLSLVDSISRLFTGFFNKVTNAATSATFQMALWELISDGQANQSLAGVSSFASVDTMRSGSYRIRDRANERNMAANWLSQSGNFSNDFDVFVLRSSASQDLLIVNPRATQVSAPATLALLLSVAFVIFTMRRRGTVPTEVAHNPVK